MLPANERLRRASAFQRAYSARKSISTPLITLYVVPRIKENRRGIAQPRMPFVGFVVAKKVCKSAVARNRSKRRVREAYRLLTQTNRMEAQKRQGPQNEAIVREQAVKLDQWYVLVWVLHSNILAATFDEIQHSVSDCLRKAESRFGFKKPGQPDGKTVK